MSSITHHTHHLSARLQSSNSRRREVSRIPISTYTRRFQVSTKLFTSFPNTDPLAEEVRGPPGEKSSRAETNKTKLESHRTLWLMRRGCQSSHTRDFASPRTSSAKASNKQREGQMHRCTSRPDLVLASPRYRQAAWSSSNNPARLEVGHA